MPKILEFKGEFTNDSTFILYAHNLIEESRHVQDFLLIDTYLVSIYDGTNDMFTIEDVED